MVDKAQALAPALVRWRREIHARPELSFQEVQTAGLVAATLRDIGDIDLQTGIGTTGVVGTLGSGMGPTIALRADMDALPITENTAHDFRSRHQNVMHACGHDAHTAILLGVAHLLAEAFRQEGLRGTVRFLFQCAEEAPDEHGLTGSRYMIEAGALDSVDAVLALHVSPWHVVGEIQVHDGYSMASVDTFRATISGAGSHAAYPHLGTDPVWMLGPVLQAVHGIVARRVSPLEPAVVSIGQIQAGTADNVIPTTVHLGGTLRSYNPDVRELLIGELDKAFAVAAALGGGYTLHVGRGEPALRNDPRVNGWIVQTVRHLFPGLTIQRAPFGLGGEDFSYMTQIVPGAMFLLGCGRPDGIERGLHTPEFDLDEGCLPLGVAILAETARRYLMGVARQTPDTAGH
jgi:amidohydrolase